MNEQMSRWVSYYLFLTMLVSSFVSSEPAPYDLLMITFIVVGLLFSFYKITKELVFPIVVVLVFLISNLISLFFVKEMGGSLLFTGITFYLAFTWIALVTVGQKLKQLDVQLIFNGYLLSALVAAMLGILAYFQMIPMSDELLMYGRAKSFFKDPNVFGPFLVIPALFALSMTEVRELQSYKKVIYFAFFIVLAIGILVSFSRAAWGNFAISLCIYLVATKKGLIGKRIKTFTFLLIVGIPIFIFIIQSPMIEELLVQRLGYQGYDNDRFDTQRQALLSGLSKPLGIGGGQSEVVFLYAPHSLYARVLTENGVLGLLSFVLLLLVSIFRSIKSYWNLHIDSGILYLVISSSLVGIAFNSFFVDTLHWRHFWLLLALAWIPVWQPKIKK